MTVDETDVAKPLMTGQRRPVKHRTGEGVVGGSIILSAAATMSATKVGSNTVTAQIAALVATTQNSKARRQRPTD